MGATGVEFVESFLFRVSARQGLGRPAESQCLSRTLGGHTPGARGSTLLVRVISEPKWTSLCRTLSGVSPPSTESYLPFTKGTLDVPKGPGPFL